MSATAEHHAANQAFYDRIAWAYDMIANDNEKPARVAGLELLGVKAGEKVVEIGFGTGNEILDLAGRVGATGFVAGIDISSGMLAVTQKKVHEKPPAARLDLQVGDAR